MGLRENELRILLVSSNEKTNSSIEKILMDISFPTPTVSTSIPEARRLLLERVFDIVVIFSPVLKEDATNFAIGITDNSDISVLLITNSAMYDEVFDKTCNVGILTIAKPVPIALFIQTMQMISSSRSRIKALEKKPGGTVSLEERMAEIKLINEAKMLLMEKEHLSEDEAHRYIIDRAMNKRLSKKDVALSIIRKHKLGGK